MSIKLFGMPYCRPTSLANTFLAGLTWPAVSGSRWTRMTWRQAAMTVTSVTAGWAGGHSRCWGHSHGEDLLNYENSGDPGLVGEGWEVPDSGGQHRTAKYLGLPDTSAGNYRPAHLWRRGLVCWGHSWCCEGRGGHWTDWQVGGQAQWGWEKVCLPNIWEGCQGLPEQ